MKLIIGNKTYNDLNVNELIDYFTKNTRLNLAVPFGPYGNNGSIKDELFVCQHIYDNLINIKKSDEAWNKIQEFYGHQYKIKFVQHFYDTFDRNEYNNIISDHDLFSFSLCNGQLNHMGCPYEFSQPPRSGMALILKLIRESVDIFVFGFSLTNEMRKTHYVKQHIFDREEDNRSGHCKLDEINIIRWLHHNNKIDATLCMLSDSVSAVLDCNGLIPTDRSIDIVKSIYTNLEIIK